MSRIRRPAVLQNAKKGPFASAKAKGPFAKMAAAAAAWKQGQVFLSQSSPPVFTLSCVLLLDEGVQTAIKLVLRCIIVLTKQSRLL